MKPILFCFLAILSLSLGFSTHWMSSSPSTTLLGASVQTINGDVSENSSFEPSDSAVSLTITPYEIIYGRAFFPPSNDGSDQAMPLHSCLGIIQKALERISSGKHSLSTTSNSQTIIRIQHKVSHPVDPLCWLQAQTRSRDVHHPTLYFANAEQTLESAVFGSAYTHRGSSDPQLWKLVNSLPPDALIYGGERFDTETKPSQEWSDFGSGLWILPAVELRETSLESDNHFNPSEEFSSTRLGRMTTTTIAVHLHADDYQSLQKAAQDALKTLSRLSDATSDPVPPTTLPPVISRESSYGPDLDGQEIYEAGVAAALEQFERGDLEKVVLARRMDISFDPSAELRGLDLLKKWKFGGHEGGHLFYMSPGSSDSFDGVQREFVGCTPERLFQISNGEVISEALAGTRPRGSTQEADAQLSRDLFRSPKDRSENLITGHLIRDSFQDLYERGWLESKIPLTGNIGELFVRRLRHLQHICQRFRGTLRDDCNVVDVSRCLLESMHPTPAVGGYPGKEALELIREKESFAFDRGFYAGPFGCLGRDSADIVVAIRSGLVTRATSTSRYRSATSLSIYAGAGIVPGSTVQGEWAETSYKLGVVSSLFPQSPLTLQSAPTPNVAWATAFVEELIRCGVTQFYVCPGSRSTPLVAALSKALRANVGVVHALSVHDERTAGFRALGYGRGSSRPAAVITSSGTAIANLYPAIMEAGMDGVPLMVITADRPYENRATGANQAVDQVKAFSSTYIRWFRDILPPSDDVPVSLVLSDVSHAVDLSRKLRGPVHLNIQLRENLAPDAGPIRNDNRVDAVTSFNGIRFTDVPGFHRWASGGGRWMKSFSGRNENVYAGGAIEEIAQLIRGSRRGIIVVGNLRTSTDELNTEDAIQLTDMISTFAQTVGFPIIAGVQSGSLRFRSNAVIPFAEHVLKCPAVSQNMKPDLVLQIGSPLVSTTVTDMISSSAKQSAQKGGSHAAPMHHVLLHPHHPEERSDPNFTITHRVLSDISPFLKGVTTELALLDDGISQYGSELAPIVTLGRMLAEKMPDIIHDASIKVTEDIESNGESQLTEPQVTLAMAQAISESDVPESLFISNSMPVRDAEFFLYPLPNMTRSTRRRGRLCRVGVNRGASGIDGIISSAAGFSEAFDKSQTTLLLGDLAALHDLNALHSLSSNKRTSGGKRSPPLRTVIVNNDGGGIFSFLPIRAHGNDVNFDEFFGTPTSSFSFEKGTEAFGLDFQKASSFETFLDVYQRSGLSDSPCVIEAVVTGRETNVAVHQEISRRAIEYIDDILREETSVTTTMGQYTPMKRFLPPASTGSDGVALNSEKTLLLLHGWMGDKSDWNIVGDELAHSLTPEWSVIALDLSGHGENKKSSDLQAIRLALDTLSDENDDGIDDIAGDLLTVLSNDYGITSVDAVVGYSLGGRAALAMKRICQASATPPRLFHDDTKLILLSSYPGSFASENDKLGSPSSTDIQRIRMDDKLSSDILRVCNRSHLMADSPSNKSLLWSRFLDNWYNAPIWGGLRERAPDRYEEVVAKRMDALTKRGRDIASILRQCSPGRQRSSDWKYAIPENTVFVAGEMDKKYAELGKTWSSFEDALRYVELKNIGHGLLLEAPKDIAALVTDILCPIASKTLIEEGKDTRLVERKSVHVPKASAAPTNIKEECLTDERCSNLIGSIDYESFTIKLENAKGKKSGIIGVGWGDKARASEANRLTERMGLIVNVISSDGSAVGVGEVSPLPGLHPESLEEATNQVEEIRMRLEDIGSSLVPEIRAEKVLALDGGLNEYLDEFLRTMNINEVAPSVRSGLEMAFISLASQFVRMPILQALSEFSPVTKTGRNPAGLLPLSGLLMRGEATKLFPSPNPFKDIVYPSLKVKVGHQTAKEDAISMSNALQETERNGKIRADANRAWDEAEGSAILFATALEGIDVDVINRLEFIEEPLRKVSGEWSLKRQVEALERWHEHSGIPYALDESLADLVASKGRDFSAIRHAIKETFSSGTGGCAALILKPALLGLELSMRIARMAHSELGIGAVFSSSFDSGCGLAYTAFLAATADEASPITDKALFSHGIGTFNMLAGDTLSPPFASYVTNQGRLKVASLSRAFFGLGLEDMRESFAPELPEIAPTPLTSETESPDYLSSAATSSSGREISVAVSLPLPFSDGIACSRFSDLPQQSRWSPWLSSVAYVDAGRETEWTLNVRGVRFSWRAVSSMLDKPYRGITWESISGLKNMGVVEFIPTGTESCMMKVRMRIITPRIVATLFPGASVFAEDFLKEKLLKWSLEMFRDVVKADLALERGDVELGDALFGAVEGRANAIEATLSPRVDDRDEPGDK